MSSTNTKTTDTNLQGKAGFNASHESTDRDKNTTAGTNDYMVHQGGAEGVNKNISDDKDKHEKTTLTFEKKKVKEEDKNKDKDINMKDVSTKKDVSSKKDFSNKNEASSGESKGIINTIKDKVMDVLGSGDNDKDKDKDLKNKDKFSEPAPVGTSSQQHYSGVGAVSGQQHSSDLGAVSDRQYPSNLGSSGIGSDKYSSSTGSDKYVSHQAETIDRSGLGAEHKELGYDKHSNVIASKSADKEKDAGHKLDVHATVKTGGAAGSTSGSQASTYKTTESK